MGDVGLKGAWDQLVAVIPPGVMTLAAVIGVILVVFGLVSWLWRKRTGGGGLNGFPVMMVVLGGILAFPALLMGPALMLLEGLLNVFVSLIEFISNTIG